MKTILITGATDGLGLATAHALADLGHRLILHGRNAEKLANAAELLRTTGAEVATVQADLSDLTATAAMADQVLTDQPRIDVLINNAGVFKTDHPTTRDGFDQRYLVNTFAPALLTRRLLPAIPRDGRIIHLSSAAQAPVDFAAMRGGKSLQAMDAYAQSKLAITLWSQQFALDHLDGPVSIAVNPGSLLATRMVREGFGTSGNDISIGTDILVRAALSDQFAGASGRYFDNDAQRLDPHYPPDEAKVVSQALNDILCRKGFL